MGDIAPASLEILNEHIGLISGDPGLFSFEDKLSDAWSRCHERDESAFRTISAFYRTLSQISETWGAHIVLIDTSPNLGAINRAALIAAKYIVIPLASDLYSLQGLKNLGPALRNWREGWRERVDKNSDSSLSLPPGQMQAAGYVILQHATRGENRPVYAYTRWMERMPEIYRKFVLAEEPDNLLSVKNDPLCLSTLKKYRGLMSMAMEAHKPMFHLKPADGALGAHALAVKDCYKDFEQLARNIAESCQAPLS